jgi:hypothetical protein
MFSEIAVALIAFIGVIVSALVSILLTNLTLKRNLDVQVQMSYAPALIERRHSEHPKLYRILSDFSKTLKFGNVTKEYLRNLQKNIEDWDNSSAILISSKTQNKLYDFRKLLIEDLLKNDLTRFDSDDFKRNLREQIGEIENSLRSELGVYIIEYSDSRKKYISFAKIKKP